MRMVKMMAGLLDLLVVEHWVVCLENALVV